MALVYSCCFWFSLRLGGIIIGIFSLSQVLLLLIVSCLSYANPQIVKDEINYWTSDLNLLYAKSYLENILADPQKYLSLSITFSCIYIISCILYIYGAYACNNMLMISFILVELFRLTLISIMVATTLLLIKQNAMDIGLLIGASVAGGFLLLGMFYLWICVANLPILINEMKNEDQEAVIHKLKQLLDINNQSILTRNIDSIPFAAETSRAFVNKNVFVVSSNENLSVQCVHQRPKLHQKIN